MNTITCKLYTVEQDKHGLDNVIELILKLKNLPFEHVVLTKDQVTAWKTRMPLTYLPMLKWTTVEAKETTTWMGLMPIVEMLAKHFHLMGDTQKDALKIETMIQLCVEFNREFIKLLPTFSGQTKWDTNTTHATLDHTCIPTVVTKFHEVVEKTFFDMTAKFTVTDKLTLADCFLFTALEMVSTHWAKCPLQKYTKLSTWKDSIVKVLPTSMEVKPKSVVLYTLNTDRFDCTNVIKLMLTMKRIPFEHVLLTTDQWNEWTGSWPDVSLPMLKMAFQGTTMTTTYMELIPIVKLLATSWGWMGNTDDDVQQIETMIQRCIEFQRDYATLSTGIDDMTVPKWINTFWEEVETTFFDVTNMFTVSDKLTLADLFLKTTLDAVTSHYPHWSLDKYTKLSEWKVAMVKTWPAVTTVKPSNFVLYTVDTHEPDLTMVIKSMLKMKHVPFEHVQLTVDQWTDLKTTMPYLHMPLLKMTWEDSMQTLVYMNLLPIVKILAEHFHLLGDTEQDVYRMEKTFRLCTDLFRDLFTSCSMMKSDTWKWKSTTVEHIVIPTIVTKFLERVGSLVKPTAFVAGSKVSVSDIMLLTTMDQLVESYKHLDFDRYPEITTWMSRVVKEIPVAGDLHANNWIC